MKILFLTSGSIKSNFTYRALSLAKEFKKMGHDAAIVCPKADKYNGFKPEKIQSEGGVRVLQPRQFSTDRPEINLLPYIFDALKITFKEKPDIIYIYKPTPISIVGLAAKFLRRTPVILDMDDLGREVMKVEGHPLHQQKLVEWCEKAAEKHCDRIVAASSYLFAKYRSDFPDKPVYLMPNGVDEKWLHPVIHSPKNKRIVFMGSLNRRNIVEPLLDIFPEILCKHPETEILLMGDGKYLDYFKEKAELLGISKRIIFTGWLDIQQARENLKAGDIGYGFMPDDATTRAASNMKIPQYMIRGVVPLVSRTGDLPKSVDNGRAGYICKSESLEDIETEMLRALEDKERKTSKAAAARNFAIENFTWKKLAEGFEEWIGFGKDKVKKKSKKKIFLVTTNVPGDTGGAEIRNLNLLKQLCKKSGAEVKLFCIRNKENEKNIIALEKDLGISVHSVYRHPGSLPLSLRALLFSRMQPFMEEYKMSGLGEEFRKVCENELPDIVQIEQIEAYYCIRPHIAWLRKQGTKIVLDAHNIEAKALEGAARSFPPAKKAVGELLIKPLRKLEMEAAKNSDAVFACSQKDAEYFKRYARTFVVPNGVDCGQFRPQENGGEPKLIFIGGVKYSPNADALRFYLKSIHPKVKKSIPEIRLIAIGATPQWMKNNGIKDPTVLAAGFVEDIEPYLAQASVGICPIRQGSGTRLKVLTFMAAGIPTVSTAKGAEGIICTAGEDIIIKDDSEGFAESIVSLLSDESLRRNIGSKARRLAKDLYDWDTIGDQLISSIRKI